MNYKHCILNLIARQYNEKWRFLDYDRAIKKLQCHKVQSFLTCIPQNFDGIIHDYDVPVYICKFSPSKLDSRLLAVANENGTVCIESMKTKKRTYIQTHNNTVFDLAWMPGENQFVTVSGDHSAKLWDYGQSNIKMVSEFLGHTRSVKCVYFKPENTSVFATGSRDGSLILWDVRCSKKCSKMPDYHIPDQVIYSAAGTSPFASKRRYFTTEASQSNSVTGLIFQNDNTLISSGSSDKCIRVWDMRKTYSRSTSLPLPKYQLVAPSAGFSHICIDPSGTKIYANSMDSYIYCFNVNTYHPDPISAFYGHQNGSFYVKSSLSPDGWYLLSGSTDKFAYIWNTRNAELSENAIKPIALLPGHTAEVACAVMSLNGDIEVATCSDDGTYRIWCNYDLKDVQEDQNEDFLASAIFDSDYSNSVRIQWKNKRKLSAEEDVLVPAKIKSPCTFHAKICRFYSSNLATASDPSKCRCHSSASMKRSVDKNNTEDKTVAKKLPRFEDDRTLMSNELKTGIKQATDDLKSQKQAIPGLKSSVKRKLLDLPPFREDFDSKRKTCERILLPINDIKINVSESNLKNVEVIDEFQATQYQSIINNQYPLREIESHKDIKESNRKFEFSSPTSDLPNYVKDGTSPYIHRCPKNQKENSDWLTKLRKRNYQNLNDIAAEVRETVLKGVSPNNTNKIPYVGLKRKLIRSNSVGEGKNCNHTLHKYFKIANKSTELTCLAQESLKTKNF